MINLIIKYLISNASKKEAEQLESDTNDIKTTSVGHLQIQLPYILQKKPNYLKVHLEKKVCFTYSLKLMNTDTVIFNDFIISALLRVKTTIPKKL